MLNETQSVIRRSARDDGDAAPAALVNSGVGDAQRAFPYRAQGFLGRAESRLVPYA